MTLALASSNYEFLNNYRFKEFEKRFGRDDAVIYAVAAFLRAKSRKRNGHYRGVRWSDFKTALSHLGFYFGERNRNKVEIYHLEREKVLGAPLGKKTRKVVDIKVDIPGEKCQMDIPYLKSILKTLNIKGDKFDYNAIFENEELYCMMQDYEGLIARLKDE